MRNTDTSQAIFPVETRPLFYGGKDGVPRPLSSRYAIVDSDREEVLGVVGSGYRLVTNAEALGFAHDCAAQLFGSADLQVFNVDLPRRRSYCRIDLIQKGFEVNVMKSEVYLPFMRMTNSFNATRALRFDVGFCRKLCLNGVIFEQQAIQFSFPHSSSGIGIRPDFKLSKGKLDGMKRRFESDAEKLHGFSLKNSDAVGLVAMALDLPRLTQEESAQRKETRTALIPFVRERVAHYFDSLGENAYATLNAATDLASHPPEIKGYSRTTHSMQTRVGTWANDFCTQLGKTDFQLDQYLKDVREGGWN